MSGFSEPTISWRIASVVEEAPGVSSLWLEPLAGGRPTFIAGQYLTVRVPGLVPSEGKSYTISSAPQSRLVRLTIKAMGDFSRAILAHTVGDSLTTTPPFGYFYPEPEDVHPFVFVAGGIGVTPAMSILSDLVATHSPRRMYLLYSHKTEADAVFRSELVALTEQTSRLHVEHYLTQSEPQTLQARTGRLTGQRIIDTVTEASEAEFFICGSMHFTKDMWWQLRSVGVPAHQLYTEGFF